MKATHEYLKFHRVRVWVEKLIIFSSEVICKGGNKNFIRYEYNMKWWWPFVFEFPSQNYVKRNAQVV